MLLNQVYKIKKALLSIVFINAGTVHQLQRRLNQIKGTTYLPPDIQRNRQLELLQKCEHIDHNRKTAIKDEINIWYEARVREYLNNKFEEIELDPEIAPDEQREKKFTYLKALAYIKEKQKTAIGDEIDTWYAARAREYLDVKFAEIDNTKNLTPNEKSAEKKRCLFNDCKHMLEEQKNQIIEEIKTVHKTMAMEYVEEQFQEIEKNTELSPNIQRGQKIACLLQIPYLSSDRESEIKNQIDNWYKERIIEYAKVRFANIDEREDLDEEQKIKTKMAWIDSTLLHPIDKKGWIKHIETNNPLNGCIQKELEQEINAVTSNGFRRKK